MIRSFGDAATEAIFNHGAARGVSAELARAAAVRLDQLNHVRRVDELRIPPGNRLERLAGDLAGWYSIRVNRQWRIVFQWDGEHAHGVRLVDYH